MVQVAIGLLPLQLMLFVMSPAPSLRTAYVDSWRKMARGTGWVFTRLFQLQHGSEQWIGFAAFGLVGFYVVIFSVIDTVARFAH
ncbi:hypothetical protein A9762_12400 [Pandoraea sp. ISTKB]|nr:hypothetical protein A9762_11485 [Pandoraea sp. ISTKB]ODP35166.1 hypothetical protein A9762_12400 [Pandoraea sp. ISTKB]